MRHARVKRAGHAFYHCMSRVVDRQRIFGPVQKEELRRLVRAAELFSGVRVVTYCIMDNHFHLVVEVPDPVAVGDDELELRLAALYGAASAGKTLGEVRRLKEAGHEAAAEALRRRYMRRMHDVSEFMKTVKERFSGWYNRTANRRGTLWEGRFGSTLVEDGLALWTISLYVDLNPVRACMVADPSDYRYCGYGEACAGVTVAQEGINRIVKTVRAWGNGGGGTEEDCMTAYRRGLLEHGQEQRDAADLPVRAGFDAEWVRQQLEGGVALSRGDLLRCRVRYFYDGLALGSRAFLEEVFAEFRDRFGRDRRGGVHPMDGGDWGGLCVARALRLPAISVPQSRSG